MQSKTIFQGLLYMALKLTEQKVKTMKNAACGLSDWQTMRNGDYVKTEEVLYYTPIIQECVYRTLISGDILNAKAMFFTQK